MVAGSWRSIQPFDCQDLVFPYPHFITLSLSPHLFLTVYWGMCRMTANVLFQCNYSLFMSYAGSDIDLILQFTSF